MADGANFTAGGDGSSTGSSNSSGGRKRQTRRPGKSFIIDERPPIVLSLEFLHLGRLFKYACVAAGCYACFDFTRYLIYRTSQTAVPIQPSGDCKIESSTTVLTAPCKRFTASDMVFNEVAVSNDHAQYMPQVGSTAMQQDLPHHKPRRRFKDHLREVRALFGYVADKAASSLVIMTGGKAPSELAQTPPPKDGDDAAAATSENKKPAASLSKYAFDADPSDWPALEDQVDVAQQLSKKQAVRQMTDLTDPFGKLQKSTRRLTDTVISWTDRESIGVNSQPASRSPDFAENVEMKNIGAHHNDADDGEATRSAGGGSSAEKSYGDQYSPYAGAPRPVVLDEPSPEPSDLSELPRRVDKSAAKQTKKHPKDADTAAAGAAENEEESIDATLNRFMTIHFQEPLGNTNFFGGTSSKSKNIVPGRLQQQQQNQSSAAGTPISFRDDNDGGGSGGSGGGGAAEETQLRVKCLDASVHTGITSRCAVDSSVLCAPRHRAMMTAMAMLPDPLPPHLQVATFGVGPTAIAGFVFKYFAQHLKRLDVVTEPTLLNHADILDFGLTARAGPVNFFPSEEEKFLLRSDKKYDLLFVSPTQPKTGERSKAPLSGDYVALVRKSLSTVGVASFELKASDWVSQRVILDVFGQHNVFFVPVPRSQNELVALAAYQLPRQGVWKRHILHRAEDLSYSFRLPYDLGAHLPSEWAIW